MGEASQKDVKQAIRKAFLKLSETKPLCKITVVDICKLAGINRSSFYYRYPDPYAISDEIEAENLQRLKKHGIENTMIGENWPENINNAYQDLVDDERIRYSLRNQTTFVKAFSAQKKAFVEVASKLGRLSRREAEIAITYVMGGTMAVWFDWVDNPNAEYEAEIDFVNALIGSITTIIGADADEFRKEYEKYWESHGTNELK